MDMKKLNKIEIKTEIIETVNVKENESVNNGMRSEKTISNGSENHINNFYEKK